MMEKARLYRYKFECFRRNDPPHEGTFWAYDLRDAYEHMSRRNMDGYTLSIEPAIKDNDDDGNE